MKDKIKYVVIDRTESLAQSIATDVFTLIICMFLIWFSAFMGGGFFFFFTVGMFVVYLLTTLSIESSARAVKLKTKLDAIEWANNLEDT